MLSISNSRTGSRWFLTDIALILFSAHPRLCEEDLKLFVADDMFYKCRDMLLYSNNKSTASVGRHLWQAVHFKHPSTFDTLAVEPSQLQSIKADLDAFVAGKEYFQRVGRPWKRGYLLYGPAGSGKSSMIAAIANYLKWDVYDLELTQVWRILNPIDPQSSFNLPSSNPNLFERRRSAATQS